VCTPSDRKPGEITTNVPDFDLLVVVRGRTPDKAWEVVSIIVDTEMERGLSFSPLIKDANAFMKEKEYHTPFYQNIMKDGVAL